MKNGIYKDLSNEAYHADSAISRSGIISFLDSPFKYWANYINPKRPQRVETEAMRFGSAFHTFVLEHNKFKDIYDVKPDRVYKKDVGGDLYNEYLNKIELLEQSKKIILSATEMNTLYEMKESLIADEQAWEAIHGGVYESSYFWEDKLSGVRCKARPDILQSNMIIDLKTIANASSRTYQRAMVEGGYHIQGAMIREAIREVEGRDVPNVINICVEKTYPYAIGIKIISESALDAGLKKFKQTLLDIKFADEHNTYQDYPIETVDLPNWGL